MVVNTVFLNTWLSYALTAQGKIIIIYSICSQTAMKCSSIFTHKALYHTLSF